MKGKYQSIRDYLAKPLIGLNKELVDTDKAGMRDVIEEVLEPLYTTGDHNHKYQKPLSLLYKTGKFKDIINVRNEYRTNKLSNVKMILDREGNWSIMNKLNTNYTAISYILIDVIQELDLVGDYLKHTDNKYKLINWLKDLKYKHDLVNLIRKMNLGEYAQYIRKSSSIGQENEDLVSGLLEKDGYRILYKGGDGDLIDMIYGVDLICEYRNKIVLIQVKSSLYEIRKSMKRNQYRYIDYFCYLSKDKTRVDFVFNS